MVRPNQACPICEGQVTMENVSRKNWLADRPIRLDYVGRVICQRCADWIDNTEWD